MPSYKDNVRVAISNTPGAGSALTVGSPVDATYAGFAAGDNGLTFAVCAVEPGVGAETFEAVYTHSGTSLSRGTRLSSTSGARINLTSAAVVTVVAASESARRWDSAGLTTTAASVTTADVTGVVGTLHYLDLSGLTAARNFTLPAVAAVDDRVGVYVSAGCTTATRELILKAGAGDTLNGVSAAEWSRVFITGECVVMRCVVANTAWVVEYDGRIACAGAMTRTTAQTMPTGGFNKINCATSEFSVGSIVNTGSSRIDIRRAGNYLVGGFIRIDLNDGKSLVTGLGKNATVVARGQAVSAVSPGAVGVVALSQITFAAADQVELYIFHDHGSNRDTETVADSVPRIYATEVL